VGGWSASVTEDGMAGREISDCKKCTVLVQYFEVMYYNFEGTGVCSCVWCSLFLVSAAPLGRLREHAHHNLLCNRPLLYIGLSVAAYSRASTVSGPLLSRLVTPALFEKPMRGADTISCLGIKQQPVPTGE
jgi:hypothetical protein